ncbi:energy transducer TonB [Parvularcula lutaonensis]|uniref:TonB C-terminal domain-containing protein n=1 Tax=Parvularcula lutaonensis TaxID=491923 RepID=A0ABV7MA69_9PROT|nr:hypothetical protein [Parvularcula lutaonensis]GGY41075.1 hypothetical protein GCM10007148_07070 [Parvularcula lutaonensis]
MRSILSAMFLTLASMSPVEAGETSWREHYRAFAAAMTAGDEAAAIQHAEAAWLAASRQREPGENRALLAQNSGLMAGTSDPGAALPALKDALALSERGFGVQNYGPDTLRFLVAEAEAAMSPSGRTIGRAADLIPRISLQERTSEPILKARIRLRSLSEEKRQWGSLEAVAGGMSDDYASMPDVSAQRKIEAEALRFIAVLSDPPRDGHRGATTMDEGREGRRYAKRMDASVERFAAIQKEIGPQESLERFDPFLAQAMAWHTMVTAYQGSYDPDARGRDRRMPVAPTVLQGACKMEIPWERQPLDFPDRMSGYNGAVVIGYHLDDDGRTTGLRILSELPSERFGDAMLQQVAKWQADVTNLSGTCMRDRTAVLSLYTIR